MNLEDIMTQRYANQRWAARYFKLAEDISTWTKDPSRGCGAVAVGEKGQVLSQGYNGFPRGIIDSADRLNNRETKYKYIVHAEKNCIYNACLNGVSLDGADLYVYGLPVCSDCALGIIQVGIKTVYMKYPKDIPDNWRKSFKQTSEMFNEAGVAFICEEC
jgi:dCMP deaminase